MIYVGFSTTHGFGHPLGVLEQTAHTHAHTHARTSLSLQQNLYKPVCPSRKETASLKCVCVH